MNLDHFNTATLTEAVNTMPFTPSMMGQLNLYVDKPIATTTVILERQKGVVSVVPAVPRGGVPQQQEKKTRKTASFQVPHIPENCSILADEIQNVRAFGSEDQNEAINQVVNNRIADSRRNIETTIESHRVLGIQGKYLMADNSEGNLYNEFGINRQNYEIKLGTASTKVTQGINNALTLLKRGLGSIPGQTLAICSESFYSKLTTHDNVEKYYLNQPQAGLLVNAAWQPFNHNGVQWLPYRGSSLIEVPDGEAFLFPRNVGSMFLTHFAPAPYSETVNTLGLPLYAKSKPKEFDKGFDIEVQSNPLSICTRPEGIIRLTTN